MTVVWHGQAALRGRATRQLFALAAAVLLTACDLYETAPGGEGGVFVLNRITGSVEHIRATDLHPPAPAAAPRRPIVVEGQEIADANTQVSIRAKVIGNALSYELRLEPTEGAKADLEQWRKYVLKARFDGARVIPKFYESDGFIVAEDVVPLSDFTQVVDDAGNVAAFANQSRVVASEEQLGAAVRATCGWGAWPAYPEPPESAAQKRPTWHQVAPGETAWDVARRYGVSVDALLSASQMANVEDVRPGMRLRVPAPEKAVQSDK